MKVEVVDSQNLDQSQIDWERIARVCREFIRETTASGLCYTWCRVGLGNILGQFESASRLVQFQEYSDFVYFGRDPNTEQTRVGLTIDEMREILSGRYLDVMLCRMIVVDVYTRWEEYTRRELSEAVGVDRCRITCPLMGDIRKFRNSIIHRKELGGEFHAPEFWESIDMSAEDPGGEVVRALLEECSKVSILGREYIEAQLSPLPKED